MRGDLISREVQEKTILEFEEACEVKMRCPNIASVQEVLKKRTTEDRRAEDGKE